MTHLVVWLLACSACRERANPKDEPPPSRVTASKVEAAPEQKPPPNWAEAIKIDVGFDAARGAVVADLRIAPGFHAYTEGETIGRPLKLESAADSELKVEAVQYPTGTTKELPLGRSVIVEGDAEVVGKIAAPVAGKKVKGQLAYQVCTDEACDRPRTLPFEVAVAP